MSIFPTKILLASDGSEDAALAARAAVDLSSGTGAELHLVHAWQEMPERWYPTPYAARIAKAHADWAWDLLERQVEEIKRAGAEVVKAHRRLGRPAEEIVELAGDVGVGLIVVGSRGLGPVRRLTMGSVSEGVVHHAHCPVLVVRGGHASWPPKQVIIGDDGSEPANRAAEMGAGIGKLLGADVLLVHAHPRLLQQPELLPQEERELYDTAVEEVSSREQGALERHAAELAAEAGRPLETRFVTGDAAQALLDVSEESGMPSLVVVGSRGLDTTERLLLGSVSTKVLRAAKGPVLVYPHGAT